MTCTWAASKILDPTPYSPHHCRHEQISNTPSNVWAADDLERRNDAMWRRIHKALRRRRTGAGTPGSSGSSVGEAFTGSQQQKWSMVRHVIAP